VLRGDGTSVYITQDIGTADLKDADYTLDRSIYVVGSEQDYHFAVLFAILSRLGRRYAPGLFHLSYGMVDLPSGKMKSREGNVVDADDLMEETVQEARNRTAELGKIGELAPEEAENLYEMLGIGALKYFLLKVEPKKRMTFNPAESIDLQGNTATAIQYTHARIRSVLRNGAAQGLEPSMGLEAYTLHADERTLLVHLATLPHIVGAAAEAMAPSPLAAFAYELSRAFNKFFSSCSILSAETIHQKQFRLALASFTARALQTAMQALGIGLPERM
jgi:arginyl-tRNA synthetase